MAIAIDASTPAIVSGASSTQTTAGFNPPAASLLVACIGFEASGSPASTITLSNNGAALTWTQWARRDLNDSGAESGIATIYTAPCVSARTGLTVSAVSSKTGDAGALKVVVVTGAELGSVGATGEGSSGTDDITPTVYVSTVAGSRAIGVGNDFQGRGAGSSSDVGFGWDIASRVSGVAVHKAANTATSGASVTLNFNGGGIGPAWNWVAVEIIPPIPIVAGRGLVVGQAVQRASFF